MFYQVLHFFELFKDWKSIFSCSWTGIKISNLCQVFRTENTDLCSANMPLGMKNICPKPVKKCSKY